MVPRGHKATFCPLAVSKEKETEIYFQAMSGYLGTLGRGSGLATFLVPPKPFTL
jgi:hypothetical protein